MRSHINSSDIRKRNLILDEAVESPYPSKQCEILSEIARKDKSDYSIKKFFKECSQNSINATDYADDCINLLKEKSESKELLQIFKNDILTKIKPYTLNSLIDRNLTPILKEAVQNQIITNKVCDRVISNNSKINQRYNIENFIERYPVGNYQRLIEKVCSTVDTFDMPTYAKYNCAIEESFYLMEKHNINFNEKDAVQEIYNYFCISCNPSLQELAKMNNVTRNNYMLTEGLEINKAPMDNSSIINACNSFIRGEDHSVFAFGAVKAAVINAGSYEIKNHFFDFLNLMINICSKIDPDDKLSELIIYEILPKLHDELYTEYESCDDARDIFYNINLVTKDAILKCDDILNSWEVNNENVYRLQQALKEFDEKILQFLDYIYPKYNIESMNLNSVAESNETISLDEFKVFKFDNIVTRCAKLDRYIQDKFNKFKDKTKDKIKRIDTEIFGESNIYDMINEDGSIDNLVCSFDYNTDNCSDLHEFCTDIVKDINQNKLFNYNESCYYIIKPDAVEFRLKESGINIELTEEDKKAIYENVTREDYYRLNIIESANLLNEDFNLREDSIKYFSKNPNSDLFETFVEGCSVCNIDKEVVTNIYESICNRLDSEDRTNFIIRNNTFVESYEAINNPNYILESTIILQNILEKGYGTGNSDDAYRRNTGLPSNQLKAKVNQNSLNNLKYLHNKPSTPQGNDIKNKNTSDKNNQQSNKQQNVNNQENNNAPKSKLSLDQTILKNLNNIKLYMHGLRKAAKDGDAKIKTGVENMDMTANRLGDSLKRALVSDRREAIIKGSVIPSFHKCIMIAAGLAGLWVFNPPLAVITAVGGFAASKNLTKKERALMYDDVMIELNIIDKEIQMADSKNQIKKMRQLMRMKKELERTATRIKYNIRIGKDVIPGGHYVNRDED